MATIRACVPTVGWARIDDRYTCILDQHTPTDVRYTPGNRFTAWKNRPAGRLAVLRRAAGGVTDRLTPEYAQGRMCRLEPSFVRPFPEILVRLIGVGGDGFARPLLAASFHP